MATPVNVVSSSYLVSQMGRPVRLSNGWLVGVVYDSTNLKYYVYKSQDNGTTWQQLTFFCPTASNINRNHSIVSKGTMVYIGVAITDGSTMDIIAFDATTVSNVDITATKVTVDSGQNDTGNRAIAITPDGTKLWWAHSTKNNTYPNSFNIRAGQIPINPDGTLGTPGAVEQITTLNNSVTGVDSPTIVVKQGHPHIICRHYNISSTNYTIYDFTTAFTTKDNSALTVANWGNKVVYNGASYAQSNPCTITTPNGKLHAVWHGKDSTDTTNDYIRYNNSADGIAWGTPKKLVKGTNPTITSDKNGKLFITYEDSGTIKRIESTDEFATFQGPFTIEAGTKPSSFYDPTFSTDFVIPPTIYQTSTAVRYYGQLNSNPTLTLTNPTNNQVLAEGNTLPVEGSATDQDANDPVTIYLQINNGTPVAIHSAVSDGSTAISFAKQLEYRNKRVYYGTTDLAGADLAENTDHALKVWAEDDQGGKSAEVTRVFRVIHNRPPTISGANEDLGTIMQPPSKIYTVTEPEGNPFSITEKINGTVIRSFVGVAGREETVTIPHDLWIRLDLDTPHSLTVEATDSQGLTSTRTFTFVRTETHIEFMLDFDNPAVEAHFTLDGMPKRVLVTLERYLPPGSQIEFVRVCNNAMDEVPTWEDMTAAAIAGRGHLFTNQTKTATNWRINIWVCIAKGTATERVRLDGFGGAFD